MATRWVPCPQCRQRYAREPIVSGFPPPSLWSTRPSSSGFMVARIHVLKAIPVLDTDLLEDVPVLRGCCKHEGAPSWGSGMCAVQLLYHVSPPQSTPSSAFTEARPPSSLTLEPRGLQASRKMQIPVRSRKFCFSTI